MQSLRAELWDAGSMSFHTPMAACSQKEAAHKYARTQPVTMHSSQHISMPPGAGGVQVLNVMTLDVLHLDAAPLHMSDF